MATYVISDIHGEYTKFKKLLRQIRFSEEDTLYVLGDVVDRGRHPMKVLLEMMQKSNIIPLMGNHEWMGFRCLFFLQKDITIKNIPGIGEEVLEELKCWQQGGGRNTVKEFLRLNLEERKKIVKYIASFLAYEEVKINGISYILVHAGLGDFSPEKALEEYTLDELVWERPDYEKAYFTDKYVVTGHTPTQLIKGNPRPGYIYKKNHHIAIDCGACFRRGHLAAYCLDTGEEFYQG